MHNEFLHRKTYNVTDDEAEYEIRNQRQDNRCQDDIVAHEEPYNISITTV